MSSVIRGLDLTPGPLASDVKEAIACAMASIVVSTAVYGITIQQAYTYFRHSGHDSRSLRLFVASIFVFDTLSLVLAIYTSYQLTVADLLDPVLLLNVPSASAFENGVSILLITLTQCFFAYRIWLLSKRKVVLVATILLCALLSCSLGLVISLRMYTHSYIFAVATAEMRIVAAIDTGLRMACDIVIMGSLCYYLHSRRTGFKRTDSIINQLIVYAVNRGALTVICQGGELVTIVFLPGRFIFIPFALAGPKLYCNTLFATLNARTSLREDGDNVIELDSQILNRIQRASPPA